MLAFGLGKKTFKIGGIMKIKGFFLNLWGNLSGYSDCLRCKDTWNWKEAHSTKYSFTNGCFPLCQECWEILRPHERLLYYKIMYGKWVTGGLVDINWKKWKQIEKAVLEGK